MPVVSSRLPRGPRTLRRRPLAGASNGGERRMVSRKIAALEAPRYGGNPMSKIALVVEFQLKPEKRQAFEVLWRQYSAGTLQDEEGCLQLDVLVPKKDDDRVLLYEVYRDDAALPAHMRSAQHTSEL